MNYELKPYIVFKTDGMFYLKSEGVTDLRFPEGTDEMIGKTILRKEFDIYIHAKVSPSYASASLIKKI